MYRDILHLIGKFFFLRENRKVFIEYGIENNLFILKIKIARPIIVARYGELENEGKINGCKWGKKRVIERVDS